MYNLEGKVALVTGAGGQRGMGRAIATRLAQEGADVVVNDIAANPYSDRASDSGSEWGGIAQVVEEIEATGRQAISVMADVSDSTQVQQMVRRALAHFGHIDILVNNAGSRPGPDRVPVVDLEESAFDEVQRINVKGTFLCSQAVAREMVRRGQGGKIIIISSVAGKTRRSPLRRLLRLQVRPRRLHPSPSLGTGPPQHQRQCHLPRPSRHRAPRIHRSGPSPGRRISQGATRPDDPRRRPTRSSGPCCPSRRHRPHRRLPSLRPVRLPHRPLHQRSRRIKYDMSLMPGNRYASRKSSVGYEEGQSLLMNRSREPVGPTWEAAEDHHSRLGWQRISMRDTAKWLRTWKGRLKPPNGSKVLLKM